MAYMVTAYVVMACIVVAASSGTRSCAPVTSLHSYGLYSYGLYGHGLCGHGLYSYGRYTASSGSQSCPSFFLVMALLPPRAKQRAPCQDPGTRGKVWDSRNEGRAGSATKFCCGPFIRRRTPAGPGGVQLSSTGRPPVNLWKCHARSREGHTPLNRVYSYGLYGTTFEQGI